MGLLRQARSRVSALPVSANCERSRIGPCADDEEGSWRIHNSSAAVDRFGRVLGDPVMAIEVDVLGSQGLVAQDEVGGFSVIIMTGANGGHITTDS